MPTKNSPMPTLPSIHQNIPRLGNAFTQWLGWRILRLMGWQFEGQFPTEKKFVAAVAPHTSNWDFIICMAFKLALGIEIRFLGKHSIFVGPLGRMLSHWGGIPVDRRCPHGTVGEVVKHFQQHSSLVLALAPEGTRHYKPEWKKGFLLVSVVPIAIFSNVIRIMVLTTASYVYGSQVAAGFLHDFMGIMVFVFGFAGLIIVMKVLKCHLSVGTA